MQPFVCRPGGISMWSAGKKFTRACSGQTTQLFNWHRTFSTTTSTGTSPTSKEPVIFSGIQPTGVPHLGNYLGALRQWVKLQDEAEPGTKLLFSIVDLHALTVPQDAHQLRKWRAEAFATLLAVGLDPKRSTIFYQSAVSTTRTVTENNDIDP
ncbi:Tryptophan--tRNA ligase [Penicillium argentinense]|uniref:tryptophan--tRNA ligase n=1 Tax=Penicillium argentinense TaxID=1131581 RepID=A0A9W9FF91_9EURO|nr:Tryptophan--tRNA ligase [Penicillium argentinense]KAJ5099143.1 Tryptophan--tRNA ligase [Penicillium argentinense]